MGTIQIHTLIVMTNGDVYYANDKDIDRLFSYEKRVIQPQWFVFWDAQSSKRTRLQISNISSVIEPNHHV